MRTGDFARLFSENETAFKGGEYFFFLLQMLLCQRLVPDLATVFYCSALRAA